MNIPESTDPLGVAEGVERVELREIAETVEGAIRLENVELRDDSVEVAELFERVETLDRREVTEIVEAVELFERPEWVELPNLARLFEFRTWGI
jgi:hypothetical protein